MKPQLFIHYNEPNAGRIKPVVNGYTCKPRFGGIWTSTYINGDSSWIYFCRTDPERVQMFKQKIDGMNHYVLYPSVQTKVLRINSVIECLRMFEMYGLPNTDFPKDKSLMTLDFERIQYDFDCIHLTKRGEYETRNRSHFPNLAGWNCESTLWFRWKFVHWELLYEHPKTNNKKVK